mmetsp:Transcript_23005/g.34520  ORF Transcript_23005/g.34520 Transcript_23005/m.34520 type:complete len:382 (-) Transcript_23005:206-1351(-)|eukprot:CAMPEP_0116024902 /NCGR_PEP_ID=MMETSP0321-20121206/12656_1 /TAXON_ID=163516 /ORGANISM="Leptocylindrus danicus var. danicus, Strain B650" /LENGTH=381 /DNA_ID=CAMNT_0003496847 /DNA_START=49 /DNA_END=1194 /DNA_ORIENTATION=+
MVSFSKNAILSLLLTGSTSAHKKITSKTQITADSTVGKHLLQKARKLEANQDVDFSFVTKYSIKFQGCHHVPQWNDEANDEEDVRIMTKRLVRFRLCPSDSCSADSWSGCSSDYGDYIVDMNTFVEAYWQGMEDNLERQCEAMKDICGDSNYCMYQNGMDECVDEEDANGDDQVAKAQAEFDALEYMECKEYNFENNNNNNQQQYDEYGNEIEYFIGPFCADQGGAINLALFTDDTCSAFVSDGYELFETNAGFSLPFSEDSMIPYDCMPCKEYQDQDQNNANDNNDNDEVAQVCEEVYEQAGKCETNMLYNEYYKQEGACDYISGVQIIKENGSIRTTTVEESRAASICIGIFTTTAVLLAAYVYYLKTKIGRAKITLLD